MCIWLWKNWIRWPELLQTCWSVASVGCFRPCHPAVCWSCLKTRLCHLKTSYSRLTAQFELLQSPLTGNVKTMFTLLLQRLDRDRLGHDKSSHWVRLSHSCLPQLHCIKQQADSNQRGSLMMHCCCLCVYRQSQQVEKYVFELIEELKGKMKPAETVNLEVTHTHWSKTMHTQRRGLSKNMFLFSPLHVSSSSSPSSPPQGSFQCLHPDSKQKTRCQSCLPCRFYNLIGQLCHRNTEALVKGQPPVLACQLLYLICCSFLSINIL